MTSTTPIKPVAAPALAPERQSVAAQRNKSNGRSQRRRLQQRDAARLDFEYRCLEGETPADLEPPEFFGSSADRLSKGDRIACLGFGNSFWCERLVIDTDISLQSVKTVMLLGPVDLVPRLAAVPPFDLSKIAVEDINGTWRLRLGTKIIADGFTSRAEASEAVSDLRNGRKAVSKTSAA